MDKKPVDVKETFKENKCNISIILGFNALMLIFGYMGEKGIIPKYPIYADSEGCRAAFILSLLAGLLRQRRGATD